MGTDTGIETTGLYWCSAASLDHAAAGLPLMLFSVVYVLYLISFVLLL